MSDLAMACSRALGYDPGMPSKASSVTTTRTRTDGFSTGLRRAMAVQAIEENPLDTEQARMFEMFERENWPHEKRRAHLAARIPKARD